VKKKGKSNNNGEYRLAAATSRKKKEGKNAKRPLATPGKKVNLGLRRLQVGKIDAKTEFNQTTD